MINKNIITETVNRYGTPFYLFDKDGFVENYKHLENTFKKIYPNYRIAYSYKTNYTPYICKIVAELGGYAEVVSDMEYHLAREIGCSNNKIIFNGPYKGDVLDEHILSGGLTNIDSFQEAEKVCSIAERNPECMIKIGIRINADIGANFISRFGIGLDDADFFSVLELLRKYSNIRIVGLHCHVSRARGLEAWKRRIDNLIYVADKYLDDSLEYLDLGSGMFAEMDPTLEKQFGNNVPTYSDYADVVAGTMFKHYQGKENMPILFTEPGTTVVARYMSLITSVVQTKTINGKSFATVDSSFDNTGAICRMKKLPYQTITKHSNNSCLIEKADIMGYTCLEQDCLYKEFPERIAASDIIVFENVGGYSIVNKPPFIRPNCPIFSFDVSGNIIEIKRQETFEDVFATFVF